MTTFVGLLGGIGSGKSTLKNMLLLEHGVIGVDMDSVAKSAIYTEENKPMVVQLFSSAAVNADGSYNLDQIRKEFFGNDDLYRRASSAYAPIIEKAREKAFSEIPPDTKIVLVESATLNHEDQDRYGLDMLVVVFCSPETQIKRAKARNGHTREQTLAIMAKQPKNEELFLLNDALMVCSEVDLDTFGELAKETYRKILLKAAS